MIEHDSGGDHHDDYYFNDDDDVGDNGDEMRWFHDDASNDNLIIKNITLLLIAITFSLSIS